MQKTTYRAALLCASALIAGTAGTAQAQETPIAAAATTIQDTPENTIIVTATRRGTSLQDTPINITAIGSEELVTQRVDDFNDLADFTPGMTVQDTGPRAAGTIVLRGLNADDNSSFGDSANSALATYLGEIPLYLDFKFIDMERVEVLLGPQGTLYGLGTLAGAIRYIPERPNASFIEGYAHGRVYDVAHADNLGYVADGALNVPIIEDLLAFRSTVGVYNDPGFIDYSLLVREPGVSLTQPGGLAYGGDTVTGLYTDDDVLGTPEQRQANLYRYEDANYEKTFTTRNQLGFFPWAGGNFYLTYAYQETKTGGRQANSAGVLGTGRYEAAQRYLEPSDREAHLVGLEAEIDLMDFAQLVSATAYTEVNSTAQGDVTDLLLDLDYDYELFPAFAGYTASRTKREQFNQELRLVSTHGGPVSWIIGGFYNKQDYNSNYQEMLPGYPDWAGFYRPDNIEYASYVVSETTEKAVFGEVSVEFIDGFQVTGGGRYFNYKAFIDGGTALPFFQDYPEINFRGRSGETEDDGFVWKLNTSYEFSDNLMVYGTWSTGYRIGGVNRVAPCPEVLNPGQNLCALPDELSFGPDETENKEIGVRFRTPGNVVSGNIALYHIDWTGIQLAGQTVNGAIGITVNGGTAVSKGVELALAVQPVTNLVVRGTYSYNDAHLTEVVPELLQYRDPVTGNPVAVDVQPGDRLPGSARHSGSLAATYTVPLETADLVFNWAAIYQGEVYSRVGARAGGEVIPDYMTHRASITYQMENWDLTLFANNIFDKYAYVSVGQDLTRPHVNDGVVSRYYSRTVLSPRKVGIEALYRF